MVASWMRHSSHQAQPVEITSSAVQQFDASGNFLPEPQAREDGVMIAGKLTIAQEDHDLVGVALP